MKEINLVRRITICDSRLKREENDPFLKQIVTGDEKWIAYNNVKRKRSWFRQDEPGHSTAKTDIHEKKVMLCMVGLEGNCIFQGAIKQPNHQFRRVLSSVG